jgi:hypothetical protein
MDILQILLNGLFELTQYDFNTSDNFGGGLSAFADIAARVTETTSFIRAFALADSAKYSLLIPLLATVLGRKATTVYGWFENNGDIGLRYLPTVLDAMHTVGYPMAIVRDWFAGLFCKYEGSPRSIAEVNRSLLHLVVEVDKAGIEDVEDLNSMEVVKVMQIGTEAGELAAEFKQNAMMKTTIHDTQDMEEAYQRIKSMDMFNPEGEEDEV